MNANLSLAEWLTVIFAALAVPQIGGPVFGALAFLAALVLRWSTLARLNARERLTRARDSFSGYVGTAAYISAVLGGIAASVLFILRPP